MSLKKILATVSDAETRTHIAAKYKAERAAAALRMSAKEASRAALGWAKFRADTFNGRYV